MNGYMVEILYKKRQETKLGNGYKKMQRAIHYLLTGIFRGMLPILALKFQGRKTNTSTFGLMHR